MISHFWPDLSVQENDFQVLVTLFGLSTDGIESEHDGLVELHL